MSTLTFATLPGWVKTYQLPSNRIIRKLIYVRYVVQSSDFSFYKKNTFSADLFVCAEQSSGRTVITWVSRTELTSSQRSFYEGGRDLVWKLKSHNKGRYRWKEVQRWSSHSGSRNLWLGVSSTSICYITGPFQKDKVNTNLRFRFI